MSLATAKIEVFANMSPKTCADVQHSCKRADTAGIAAALRAHLHAEFDAGHV